MHLGMVGLGRMGGNMAGRLLAGGHQVTVWDLGAQARAAVVLEGGNDPGSLEGLVAALVPPRVVWLMLPAGAPTADSMAVVAAQMAPGDVIVEGGNSNFRDTMASASALKETGVHLVDAGVSGGIWGRQNGYCLMVGGEREAVALAEPAFLTLAPAGGYAHVGPPGAGHYVKMVHNGVEYGLMQAYAEGFELLASAEELDLDLHEIAGIWRYGSVVRSWLLDLIEAALAADPGLAGVRGYVQDSGEGRWTVQEAVNRAVPVPVITAALYARFSSRRPDSLSAKLNAAMRNQFGGHAVVAADEDP